MGPCIARHSVRPQKYHEVVPRRLGADGWLVDVNAVCWIHMPRSSSRRAGVLPEATQCGLDERPPPIGIVATAGCKAAGSGSVNRSASQIFQNIDRTKLLDKIAKQGMGAN